MTQPESKLSRKIMKELRLHGYFCFKIHGGPTMMAGLPDIIVCAEGRFIGLETKMPDDRNNTSVVQDLVHDRIRDSGGVAKVVCSPHEALRVVRRALTAESTKKTPPE
jgi:hypothetical protein